MNRSLRMNPVGQSLLIILLGISVLGCNDSSAQEPSAAPSTNPKPDSSAKPTAKLDVLIENEGAGSVHRLRPQTSSYLEENGSVKSVAVPVQQEVVEPRDPENPDGTQPPVQARGMIEERVKQRVPAANAELPAGVLHRDPQQQLNAEIQKMIALYKNLDDPQKRDHAVEIITKLTAQQFEAYQKQREEELNALEAKVQKLRELHDRREKEKKDIIGDRVRGLLRNADGLGWGEENGPVASRRSLFVPIDSTNSHEIEGTPSEARYSQRSAQSQDEGSVPNAETRSNPAESQTQVTPNTYITAPSPAKSPNKTVKIFSVQHAKANDLAAILANLFQSTNIGIVADERTNSILVSGEQSDLDTIEAVVKRLDQESKAPKALASPVTSDPITSDPRYLDK
jgi:hypothetical protein